MSRGLFGLNRRSLLVGGLAAMVTAGLAANAFWPRPQAKPQPAERALGWRPIISQSGSGSAQTESFNIDTGQWRIKWSAKAGQATPPGSGVFRVGVHSSVSGRLMSVAIDHQGSGENVAYVAEEPRPFFLSIESSGLEWTVSVEEGQLGQLERP